MTSEAPETFNLLRQVRTAIGRVASGSDNEEHKALLGAGEVVLNELMLRTKAAPYLPLIAEGSGLLEEAHKLAGEPRAAEVLAGPVSERSSADALIGSINRIAAALSDLLPALKDSPGSPARALCNRICDWEARLYLLSLEDAGTGSEPDADPFTRDAFEAWLRRRFPDWGNPTITGYTVLTGGFSKRTVQFDLVDDVHGPRSLILRAEQAISLPRFSDIVQEFHLADYAVEAGLPTPAALHLEADPASFGWAFAIMEKAGGLNYGWTMGRKLEVTDAVVASIIDALCAMHTMPLRFDDPRLQKSHLAQWSQCRTVTEATRRYVSTYMQGLIDQTGIQPTPELVRAMQWLQANVPDVSDPPVLVHHDFGLNNMLIEGERVSAILDWEAAVVVDPAYDILVIQRELAEKLSVEEFLDRYHAKTGRRITPYNMAYAKVAAFAMYMIVYLNGRQSLVRNDQTPIAMALLAFRYIGVTAPQLNGLIAEAESLR
ncbi:MAG: phosphotransferase [Rhizobiaceae bacterium]